MTHVVEEILVNLTTETVSVLDVQENFTIQDIDTSFTIQQIEETFSIQTIEETLQIDVVDDLINVSQVEETLQFQLHEAIIIQENYYTEEEMPLARRIDFESNETIIYKGEASPGVLDTDSAWRIHRITINSEGDAVYQWASGNANYDKKWTDRLTLIYT